MRVINGLNKVGKQGMEDGFAIDNSNNSTWSNQDLTVSDTYGGGESFYTDTSFSFLL